MNQVKQRPISSMFSTTLLDLFNLFSRVPTCMFVCHIHEVLSGAVKGFGCPEATVTNSCESPCGF